MKETRTEAFHRIASGIRAWRESTETFAILFSEARETEIWREKYSSLKEFCEKECGITARWGRALAETTVMVGQILEAQKAELIPLKSATSLANPKILTPALAVPLKGLSAPEKALAFQAASEHAKGGIPTVKGMKEAVQKLADKKAEKEAQKDDPRDMELYRIPDEALAVWARRGEPQELMTAVSKIKCLIEDAREKEDPLYMRNSQSLIAGLTQVYSLLDSCRPYAVCTSCEGRPSVQKAGCSTCGNSGMISRFQWTQASRVEIKAIRQKVINAYK